MELYNLTDKNKYEVNIPEGSGEYLTTCPVCSHNRKPQNQKKKCLGWNRNLNLGHCHHCNASFVKYRELENQNDNSFKLPPLKPQPQSKTPKVINTISLGYIKQSLGIGSNLGKYLKKHFSEDEIEKMMKKYFLGRTKNKEVIFWYIDINQKVRSGKVIDYNYLTGKRIKDMGMMGKADVRWVHSILNKQNKLKKDWTFTRCLFGEHLLRLNPNAVVNVAESEKTVAIASMHMPDDIWLATGGKGMFTEEVCRCLKGRNVIIYPDLGATKEWEEKAKEISKAVGCNMIINDILERLSTKEQREKGLDIADFYLEANNKQTIDQ